MSEESHLVEKVDKDLLKEDNFFTIILLDGVTNKPIQEFHAEVDLENPYAFDVDRLIPNDLPMDLNRMYEVAALVIDDAQRREGIIDTERVKLVQEYQPERMNEFGEEVIAARVLLREPAKMNAKATGRPQRASLFSYDYQSTDLPNKVINVRSRPIDHRIEFAVWAKTATLANKRALWLEKLFVTHRWAFTIKGAERFFWIKRGPDTLWKHGEQRLHQRSLVFFVRLREFESHAHPALRQIALELFLNNS